MTRRELATHLRLHPLYVIERQTSRTGRPNVVSFYVISDGALVRIDEIILNMMGFAVKPQNVGRITRTVSLHDPAVATLEEHIARIADALLGISSGLSYVIL